MSKGQDQQSIANIPAVSWPAPETGSHYLFPERYPFPSTLTQTERFSIIARRDPICLHLPDWEMMPWAGQGAKPTKITQEAERPGTQLPAQ